MPDGTPLDEDEQLLMDAVATPSVTGDTLACAELLASGWKAQGFDARVDAAGNAVAVAGTGPVEVWLVGHLDTVPGRLPVRVADDVLWGRGSVDAKGCLLAFSGAARRFLESDRVRITLVGACDEEGESHGARALLHDVREGRRAAPHHLIIGEPSGADDVTLGYKGIVKIRYTLEAGDAHAGHPHPSVPDRGLAFWNAVQGYCANWTAERAAAGTIRHPIFDAATAKLDSFTTRHLANGHVRVEISGNVRTPPDFDPAAFRAFLAAREGDATIEVPEMAPAHVASKNTALVRAFLAAIRDTGATPRFLKKTGTSDLNLLAPALGIPAVAYGPGDSGLDHTPDEHLPLAEFRRARSVLRTVLERLGHA